MSSRGSRVWATAPGSLEEVAERPAPSGLVTLDEIRGCCAILARTLILMRGAGATAVTHAAGPHVCPLASRPMHLTRERR